MSDKFSLFLNVFYRLKPVFYSIKHDFLRYTINYKNNSILSTTFILIHLYMKEFLYFTAIL